VARRIASRRTERPDTWALAGGDSVCTSGKLLLEHCVRGCRAAYQYRVMRVCNHGIVNLRLRVRGGYIMTKVDK